MSRSPEFLALLDKYQLSHEITEEQLVETARIRICLFPANFEAILLAYGHIPKYYTELVSLVELLHHIQDSGKSLRDALKEVSILGQKKNETPSS